MPYKSKDKQREFQTEHYYKHHKHYRKLQNTARTKRRQKSKLALIKYKGDKCEHCKVSFPCHGVYEFHHTDPNEKDFSISDALDRNIGVLSNHKKILKELDKCLMLCANCHRIEHARLRGDQRQLDILQIIEDDVVEMGPIE